MYLVYNQDDRFGSSVPRRFIDQDEANKHREDSIAQLIKLFSPEAEDLDLLTRQAKKAMVIEYIYEVD